MPATRPLRRRPRAPNQKDIIKKIKSPMPNWVYPDPDGREPTVMHTAAHAREPVAISPLPRAQAEEDEPLALKELQASRIVA